MSQEFGWYIAEGGKPVGPLSLDDLLPRVRNNGESLVFGPGVASWTPARAVDVIAARLHAPGAGGSAVPPPPPLAYRGPGANRQKSDEIDYTIFGVEMQYVEIGLDPGETVIAEPGGMMYMTPGIRMETVFGDPSKQNQGGFLGKIATAGKRLLTGESLFMTTFTAAGRGKETIAFAAPYPGKIVPLDLDSLGGEGFIMQRLDGDGLAFVHAGGTIVQRELQAGETLFIDTGCIVALTPSVAFEVQYVGKIKTALFGGEGLFFAKVTGPGTVWLQSLPFSRLASRIFAAAPQRGGSREEGSLLGAGAVGGVLGGLLGGNDDD